MRWFISTSTSVYIPVTLCTHSVQLLNYTSALHFLCYRANNPSARWLTPSQQQLRQEALQAPQVQARVGDQDVEHPTSNKKGIGVKEQDLARIMEGTRQRSRYGSSQENRGRSRSRSHIERRKSGKISKKIFNIQSSYFFNKISFSASKKNSHHKRRSPQSPRTSSPNKKSASQQSGLFLEPNLSESDEDSSQETKGIFLLFLAAKHALYSAIVSSFLPSWVTVS